VVLHDWPWGIDIAPWDVKLNQSEFKNRISAIDTVNSHPNPVAFNLLNIDDASVLKEAYLEAGWRGEPTYVSVCKEHPSDEGGPKLINAFELGLVCWKGARKDSYWNFHSDPIDRQNVWKVPFVHYKYRDSANVTLNPAQQPVELTERVLRHFAPKSSWVFSSGTGSGADVIACIRNGYSCVATEPDRRQFDALRKRVDLEIAMMINTDHKARSAAMAKEKADEKKKKDEEKESRKTKKKKKSTKEVCLSVFIISSLCFLFRVNDEKSANDNSAMMTQWRLGTINRRNSTMTL
jgi:hypothetical protein